MIQITCTSCKNVLSIDDAFAGGVCRCQHCGTIQTVPAKVKAGASSVESTAGKSSKLLYQNKARSAVAIGSGSGLEDLAGIVASSGLSDNRLRKAPPGGADQKKLILLLSIGGGVVVLLIVLLVILFVVLRGPVNPASQAPSQQDGTFSPTGPGQIATGGSTTTPPAPAVHYTEPGCLGIKLSSDSVVYLIDDGQSSGEVLDYVKSAVYHSIESLGPQKQFAIIFWKPDSASYGPATATPEHLAEAKTKVEDVVAFQVTDPIVGLKKALAGNPGEIVLFTAKGLDLEASVATEVLAARGNSPVKIHVIDINGSADDATLSNIARSTGGTLITMTKRQIQAN